VANEPETECHYFSSLLHGEPEAMAVSQEMGAQARTRRCRYRRDLHAFAASTLRLHFRLLGDRLWSIRSRQQTHTPRSTVVSTSLPLFRGLTWSRTIPTRRHRLVANVNFVCDDAEGLGLAQRRARRRFGGRAAKALRTRGKSAASRPPACLFVQGNVCMHRRDWDTLIWTLQRQNCILFLGPELCGSPGGAETVSSASLLRTLTAELGAQLVTLPAADAPLAEVAQRFTAEYSGQDVRREVAGFYRQHEGAISPLLVTLATLPFYAVITSCHDSLIATAFRANGKAPRVERYDFRGGRASNIEMGTPTEPLVYHLYGSPAVPQSLVLTEYDLLDFLVSVISKNPPLPQSITAELQKPGKSLLFVGFGVKHWYLRILLHVLRATQADSRSFALEAFDDGLMGSSFERMVFFYKIGYKIEIFNVLVEDFVRQLAIRYEEVGAQTTPDDRAAAIRSAPARVFISYVREDREVVESVCAGLREAGFDIWMDTSLEPGVHWDASIEEQLIASDLFLVFVSEALLNKPFSYVNKEIDLALERQRYARHGTKFVVPIQLGDAPIHPRLRELQVERLADPGNVSQLVSLMRREYQRRLRV
jgi:hypothetical protein